jgi:hypothetical protein
MYIVYQFRRASEANISIDKTNLRPLYNVVRGKNIIRSVDAQQGGGLNKIRAHEAAEKCINRYCEVEREGMRPGVMKGRERKLEY